MAIKGHTLLSFVAMRYTRSLEDVATDALCFVLSRSETVRGALSDFLAQESGPLPIAKTETWAADADRALPDLACFDEDGRLSALIECKFWAQLTHHQPVTYWRRLPNDTPSVLLFLTPPHRVNQGSLWSELAERLKKAGHELDSAHESGVLITASAKDGQRRLALTSWTSLLEWLARRARAGSDRQAYFEIAELQGLAARAIADDNPRSDANLKTLMADAVNRVEASG